MGTAEEDSPADLWTSPCSGFRLWLWSGKAGFDELFVRLGSLDWSTMARFCASEEPPIATGLRHAAVATASLVLSKERGWSWSTDRDNEGAEAWSVESGSCDVG